MRLDAIRAALDESEDVIWSSVPGRTNEERRKSARAELAAVENALTAAVELAIAVDHVLLGCEIGKHSRHRLKSARNTHRAAVRSLTKGETT